MHCGGGLSSVEDSREGLYYQQFTERDNKKGYQFGINEKNAKLRAIPRLSKAGMPSRSEGWGGAEREPDRAKHQYLFKGDSTD
jgi:hypothetical protein